MFVMSVWCVCVCVWYVRVCGVCVLCGMRGMCVCDVCVWSIHVPSMEHSGIRQTLCWE